MWSTFKKAFHLFRGDVDLNQDIIWTDLIEAESIKIKCSTADETGVWVVIAMKSGDRHEQKFSSIPKAKQAVDNLFKEFKKQDVDYTS